MADDEFGNGAAPATVEQRLHALEGDSEATRHRFGDFEGRWGGIVAEQAATTRAVESFRRELQGQSGSIGNLSLLVHEVKLGLQAFREEVGPAVRELVGAVKVLVDRKAVRRGRRG